MSGLTGTHLQALKQLLHDRRDDRLLGDLQDHADQRQLSVWMQWTCGFNSRLDARRWHSYREMSAAPPCQKPGA